MFFPMLLLVLLRVCKLFNTVSDTCLVIVTLTRLFIFSPLHMFLCMYCGDKNNQCVTVKNVILPLVYYLSFGMHFATLDIPKILASKTMHI